VKPHTFRLVIMLVGALICLPSFLCFLCLVLEHPNSFRLHCASLKLSEGGAIGLPVHQFYSFKCATSSWAVVLPPAADCDEHPEADKQRGSQIRVHWQAYGHPAVTWPIHHRSTSSPTLYTIPCLGNYMTLFDSKKSVRSTTHPNHGLKQEQSCVAISPRNRYERLVSAPSSAAILATSHTQKKHPRCAHRCS
jgi:hypothetical protein